MLVHTVYFWLKPGQNRSSFKAEVEKLGSIPSLKAFHVGVPAPTEKRPIIDDSYAVALTTVFTDLAGHDAYQIHPLHAAFLAGNRDRWAKIQIYDAL